MLLLGFTIELIANWLAVRLYEIMSSCEYTIPLDRHSRVSSNVRCNCLPTCVHSAFALRAQGSYVGVGTELCTVGSAQ